MGIESNKWLGTLAESAVTTELIRRGWFVCTPEGDYAPYDRVITKGPFTHKVQIKSSSAYNHYRNSNTTSYKWTLPCGHSKNVVPPVEDIDIYILVAMKTMDYVIIPYDQIIGMKTISLSITNKDNCKWGIYVGAWGLLENKGLTDVI